MQFSQPGQFLSAKGPKLFALNATNKLKDNSCEKNYQTLPQIILKLFSTTFSNFLPVAPENFPLMSEETKGKKIPQPSP